MELRPSGLTSLYMVASVQTPSGGLVTEPDTIGAAWRGPTVRISLPPPASHLPAMSGNTGFPGGEGARPWLGAPLLAYYDPDGRLVYAGRAGTGIDNAELARLWRRLQTLSTPDMPLGVPPPRASRFGTPLVLSRV